jgi:proteasome lid subunit RPN8/RPN11
VTPLRIRRSALDDLIAHARTEAPNECCGLLLGATDSVDRVMRARNVRQSPTRYEVDPADHFAAIRLARSTGQLVLGAYHSHPRGPLYPSPTDAAEINDPTLVHVIVSLASDPPAAAAFRWEAGNFAPVDLVPVP